MLTSKKVPGKDRNGFSCEGTTRVYTAVISVLMYTWCLYEAVSTAFFFFRVLLIGVQDYNFLGCVLCVVAVSRLLLSFLPVP